MYLPSRIVNGLFLTTNACAPEIVLRLFTFALIVFRVVIARSRPVLLILYFFFFALSLVFISRFKGVKQKAQKKKRTGFFVFFFRSHLLYVKTYNVSSKEKEKPFSF